MDTRRATEGSAGVLASTSRSPTERTAVDMPGSAAAVESWREMRTIAPGSTVWNGADPNRVTTISSPFPK